MHIDVLVGETTQKHIGLCEFALSHLRLRVNADMGGEGPEIRQIRRGVYRCARADEDHELPGAVRLD